MEEGSLQVTFRPARRSSERSAEGELPSGEAMSLLLASPLHIELEKVTRGGRHERSVGGEQRQFFWSRVGMS